MTGRREVVDDFEGLLFVPGGCAHHDISDGASAAQQIEARVVTAVGRLVESPLQSRGIPPSDHGKLRGDVMPDSIAPIIERVDGNEIKANTPKPTPPPRDSTRAPVQRGGRAHEPSRRAAPSEEPQRIEDVHVDRDSPDHGVPVADRVSPPVVGHAHRTRDPTLVPRRDAQCRRNARASPSGIDDEVEAPLRAALLIADLERKRNPCSGPDDLAFTSADPDPRTFFFAPSRILHTQPNGARRIGNATLVTPQAAPKIVEFAQLAHSAPRDALTSLLGAIAHTDTRREARSKLQDTRPPAPITRLDDQVSPDAKRHISAGLRDVLRNVVCSHGAPTEVRGLNATTPRCSCTVTR